MTKTTPILPSLHDAERITIKVGSALICESGTGVLRKTWLSSLADDIAALRKAGKEVIVVSSGGVALGRKVIGVGNGPLAITERQAAAACGQPLLLQAWQDALAHHAIGVGQNLLTAEDSEDRRRYVNARNTLNAMLDHGIVPVINENDTVTTRQIRYGDNDRLAARIATMTTSDALVLLSDIDGLYTADPHLDPSAIHIPLVNAITPEIEAMGGDARSNVSSGGMRTKIIAAEICTAAGCHMVIARGAVLHPIAALDKGALCTWFAARETPLSARKQWIAASQHINGTLVIDDGAANALRNNHSLLAVGIRAVEGKFSKGDSVWIRTQNGEDLAKGISGYDDHEVKRILGKKSHDIAATLGYDGPETVIHRDDLVMEIGA